MENKGPEKASGDRFDALLTVVIPAYNEAEKIRENLRVVSSTIKQFSNSYEIIVVNDGSRDSTLEQVQLAQKEDTQIRCINVEENTGKGNALKVGVQNASAQGYIAFLDADLDLQPDHLLEFYRVMQEQNADAVIGSKMHPDSQLDYPRSRRRISACYYFMLKLLFGLNVHDTQTGIKLFRAETIKRVMPYIRVKRFAYDIEVLAILNQDGARIVEAPIQLTFQRKTAWTRIRFMDMWQTGWDTLAVFYRLKIRKYDQHAMRSAGK